MYANNGVQQSYQCCGETYAANRDTGGGIYFECLLHPGTVLGIHGKEAASGLTLMGACAQAHTHLGSSEKVLGEVASES